ncbi:hypothetical protein [Arcticibacter sp. MXS-1]|uniref:hypothetical protein n=1 Tax=Arcticibacter sp. MXS-1 TaxID=3341726 RepID=UPI0035A85285
MKYYLVTWTAENDEKENFSGNASMQWEGQDPTDEEIIENIQAENESLKGSTITLQDKLAFDSQEDLDNYGKM